MVAIQNLTDHVHKLLGNEEHRRRQEEWSVRGSEIKVLRNVRDGFSQGRYRVVDALEMECFLIAVSAIMEHVDRSYSLLAGVKQGEAANTAFSMLSLSSHYAAATTAAQRAQFEAAGQAALTGLAVTQGAGLQVANALNAIAGVLISVVMLRSTIFSKVTASVGLVGNVLELGLPGVSVPFAVAFAIVGIGGVLLVIWYILIARQLFLLAQSIPKEEAKQPAVS